jgi:hypothetical protein
MHVVPVWVSDQHPLRRGTGSFAQLAPHSLHLHYMMAGWHADPAGEEVMRAAAQAGWPEGQEAMLG